SLGIAQKDGVYQMYSCKAKFGFFESLGRAFVYAFRIAGSIFTVLGQLLTGALGLNAMGGPITTISVTSKLASQGLLQFLEITAYIGVNLAVFNLLPIPALDGSKVVFTTIEWVRGKPVNRKVENALHFAGLFLLFGFAILVDLLHLF
ncbi:MAG: site-2 protease family protein, partial [Clostridia bacterium]|nr:site-2 protease family protein [Clostridia bacterium]